MAKLNVPPTKSQNLTLKKSLVFAKQGYDLLEQKRTILTMELMGHLDAVRQMERDLQPTLERAFAALKEATLESGSESLQRQSLVALGQLSVMVRSRPVMGLTLPVLEIEQKKQLPSFSALGSSARVDEVVRLFNEALELISKLAELQNIIIRLAHELKKTQRRVNALEKIFIPSYRETITYISDTLEERERESIVVMKMIKARLTKARAAASESAGG
jgi:V/A-type H+-transporting ATPase subunit D